MQAVDMDIVVDGRLYSTRRAVLLADDADRDGTFGRAARNTFLFRHPSGVYFAEHRGAWNVDSDYVEALSPVQARELYEQLPIHEVEPGLAFDDGPAPPPD
ncbi:MAG TPA: hypothetical protein VF937_08875 [Chloroflexota bacterium]